MLWEKKTTLTAGDKKTWPGGIRARALNIKIYDTMTICKYNIMNQIDIKKERSQDSGAGHSLTLRKK